MAFRGPNLFSKANGVHMDALGCLTCQNVACDSNAYDITMESRSDFRESLPWKILMLTSTREWCPK